MCIFGCRLFGLAIGRRAVWTTAVECCLWSRLARLFQLWSFCLSAGTTGVWSTIAVVAATRHVRRWWSGSVECLLWCWLAQFGHSKTFALHLQHARQLTLYLYARTAQVRRSDKNRSFPGRNQTLDVQLQPEQWQRKLVLFGSSPSATCANLVECLHHPSSSQAAQ